MQSNRSNKTRRLGSRPSILVLMVFCGLVTSVCAVMQGVPLPDIPVPAAPAATKAPPGPTAPPEPTSPSVSKAEPSATSLWSGGTEQAGSVTRQPAYFFSEEDCGCATFPGEVEPSYGPGYLECNYRWNGKYIDDNHASFILQQYDDPAELTQVFNEHVGWSYDSADEDRKFIDSGSLPDDEQYIIRNDPNGFNYVTTGPGGGSSKVEGEIPMCGNGGGVLLVDDYLAEIRLFSCDLGEERLVYETAGETLQACALQKIAKAKAALP